MASVEFEGLLGAGVLVAVFDEEGTDVGSIVLIASGSSVSVPITITLFPLLMGSPHLSHVFWPGSVFRIVAQ
ncbi:hypothetical protein ColTof4_05963 [Colletotrichum tofieldiae]|nr:hypothetical protein ColTof3_01141 [Colletotrichum tofieldiae]GKT73540.1 hypothetical protein ColTof4_05963 [Colletotrichum tofieldiae]